MAINKKNPLPQDLKKLKVAVVHNWLWSLRGAERSLEAILEIFPDADLYALFGYRNLVEKSFSTQISSQKVNYSWLNRLPFISRLYRYTIFLWPFVTEQWDFSKYDLVISSSASTVKGIITGINTLHISYIYSPMRYIWDLQPLYMSRGNILQKIFFYPYSLFLRIWDVSSTKRIDHLIAISDFVAKRITKYYGRSPDAIIYPPVELVDRPRSHYRLAGLVVISPFQENKGAEVAINYALKYGESLTLIGDGPSRKKLEKVYGRHSNIKFTGWVSEEEKYKILRDSEALLFLGVEDFGLVPLEAAMVGTPTLALKKGGALESVLDGVTGIFVDDGGVDSVREGMTKLRRRKWEEKEMRSFASRFSKENFKKEFAEEVSRAFGKFSSDL